jgi:tetratricopeptide (TPR) repeat protein
MKNAVIAIDLDDRIHIGAEHWFYDILAVRGGIQKDFVTDELPLYSIGGSLKYSLFQFDYAYQHVPPVDDTHRLSMSMAFDFNPSLVKIQEPEISSIFPALYQYYNQTPIGKVTLRNKRKKEPPLEVTVGLKTPYSKKAIETGVNLEPGAKKEIQVTASFSDKLFEVTSTTPKTAEIKVSYQSGKRTKYTTKTVKMYIYDRNSIRWSDGIDRAAVFVTSRDAVVKEFVNKTLQETKKHSIKTLVNRNFTVAMILFDALAAYGISYKADPENSYERMSAEPGIIDTIQYPRELLYSKQGDCDDCTMLYMACLANNDIPTAFVDAPKHIYCMFDLSIKPEDAEKMLLNKDLYIVRGGSVWIPIETTKLGKGSFLDACLEGVREYRVEKSPVIELADVRRNFEQVSFKAVDWLPQMDASVAVSGLLTEDIQQFDVQRDMAIQQKFVEIEKQNMVQQVKLLSRGKVYANCRMFDKAEQEFKKIGEENFDTLFNIGLCLSGQNKEIDAIKNYKEAMLLAQRLEEQAYCHLALARSYNSQGDIASCEQELQEAFKIRPNLKYDEEVKKLQAAVPPKPGEAKSYEADEVSHLDLILKLIK